MENNWEYLDEPLTDIKQVPFSSIGFVYLISTDNGRYYIGKKNLYFSRKKKFGKKKLAEITDMRKKKYEMITKESDWLTYTGSNNQMNEDIKNGVSYYREILSFAFSKRQLTYLEAKYQMKYAVLEDVDSYNDSIAGKFYKSHIMIK